MARWIAAVCACLGLVLPGGPTAASDGPALTRVEAGWNGVTRLGSWAPLRIHWEGTATPEFRVRVEYADPDDQTIARELPLVTGTGSGEERVVHTAFRPGRSNGTLVIEIPGGSSGKQVLRFGGEGQEGLPTPLRHDVPLWGTLGKLPGLESVKVTEGGRRVLEIAEASALPHDPRGYETFDAFLIATGRTGDAAEWERITPPQAAALLAWVRSGGHLVVTVGANADKVAASPLGQALPMTFRGGSSTRQLGRLESLCSATSPIPLAGSIPRALIERRDESGTTLAEDGAGPILLRAPVGFGLLTVLAVDFDTGPLAAWKNVGEFAPHLVESAARRSQRASDLDNPLRHQGLSDIASQWSAKLDTHSEVRRTSYWTVLGLLFVLMAVVGPLDYWLVNRWLGRPLWTWFTLPAWAALAVLLGGLWAGRSNGAVPRASLLEIIDVDVASNRLRGTAWLNVYSPRTARETITVQPPSWGSPPSQAPENGAVSSTTNSSWLDWMSEPESAPGGLYRGSTLSTARGTYQVNDATLQAERVPLLQWSTKQLLARWESDAGEAWVDNKLESGGPGRVAGSVTLKRNLPLLDVVLIHGGRIYFPGGEGALRPFVPWQPNGADSRQRDLRSFLTGTTGRRVQLSQNRSEVQFKTEPYDPLNFDSTWLFRMSSFLQAAGGRVYAGLDNRFLHDFDMTDAMNAGRAILIGRLDRPLCGVRLGETDLDVTVSPSPDQESSEEAGERQASFVRIVLPVAASRDEQRLRKEEFKEEIERLKREGNLSK